MNSETLFLRFMLSLLFIVLGLPLALIGLFWIQVTYIDDGCGVPIQNTTVSPVGPMAVVIFEADCGATTGSNTLAVLAPSVADFDPAHDPMFMSLRGQHAVTVRWLDPKTVELTIYYDEGYPADRRVLLRDDHVGDIKVIYK